MGTFLSRIGIGSAEVDAILETDTVRPGDDVGARIEIEGGSAEQTVDEIDLAVMTRYEYDEDDAGTRRETIVETELTDGFTIEPGEERTIDAGEIRIPETTPPTLGKTKVWVYTGLDIDWSIDPKDQDYLTVEPGPYQRALLDAVENLGFRRKSAENIKSRIGPHSFVQELEYRPRSGPYVRDLDEIELFPYRQGDELAVVVEIDKTGLSVLEMDESHHRMTVNSTDPAAIERRLTDLIDEQL